MAGFEPALNESKSNIITIISHADGGDGGNCTLV